MRAHHRVSHRRMLRHRAIIALLVPGIRPPAVGGKGLDHRMLGSQALQLPLLRFGQSFIGGQIARPQGSPPTLRQLLGGQDAGQRRRSN